MNGFAALNPAHAALNIHGHGPCLFYTPGAQPWLASNPYILESISAGITNGGLTHHPYLLAVDADNILRLWCCHAGAFLEASRYLAAVFPEDFFRIAANFKPNQRGYSTSGLLFSGLTTLWQHILMLGYLYYKRDTTIVPDEYFDQLCVAAVWRYKYGAHVELEGHIHGHLFNVDELAGGSVHHIEFPRMVESAAEMFVNRERILSTNQEWEG